MHFKQNGFYPDNLGFHLQRLHLQPTKMVNSMYQKWLFQEWESWGHWSPWYIFSGGFRCSFQLRPGLPGLLGRQEPPEHAERAARITEENSRDLLLKAHEPRLLGFRNAGDWGQGDKGRDKGAGLKIPILTLDGARRSHETALEGKKHGQMQTKMFHTDRASSYQE